jgi:transcriptional regulator NrdR family protein
MPQLISKPSCPYCGSQEYQHIKTEKFKDQVVRGWKCLNRKCRRSFTSFEKFVPEPYYKKELPVNE